ncbi:unnamed protein product [Coregonus sp. 'balchen']|nr:unnamed protein product [Coregonus sp. 'balchen']
MASHLSLSILLLIFCVSVKTGGSITIPCPYHQEYKTHVKYWCKGYYFNSCSPVVRTYLPKSTAKASISDDINQLTFTVTMTDLGSEDSEWYCCAVVINGLPHVWTNWFQLSVTPGTPELYVDQQEVTGVEGGSVIVNCYYSDTRNGKEWCWIGGSVSCMWGNSGSIDGTSVTLQQTTDATRRNILTVTMSGLKMDNTGWYNSIDLKVLLIPLGMLVVVIAGVLVTWKMWRKHSTPELYVDQLEVTGVEGGSVMVNCYYSDTGNRKWCRIGDSISCMWGNSGTLDGTSVTLQQTTDATRGKVLTVAMSGLKMDNTGWYRCRVGDLMMTVHITVRRQTTTQSTTTMTTTQAPTTEQSSFSPTAEPVQTDNTVQGPEEVKEKDTMRRGRTFFYVPKIGNAVLFLMCTIIAEVKFRAN